MKAYHNRALFHLIFTLFMELSKFMPAHFISILAYLQTYRFKKTEILSDLVVLQMR